MQPFAGLRPKAAYAEEVAAPPYDVLTTEEARLLAKNRPWSFLHISKPDIDLPPNSDPYGREVYAKCAENMARMLKRGILIQDDIPSYYVYRIQVGEHCQTGVVGAGSIGAYENNTIRRHELTRYDKEVDRVNQILAVNAHTGPVLALHKFDAKLSSLTEEIVLEDAAYSIITEQGEIHTLWVVKERHQINTITKCFERIGVIYIADGHHRSAAASRVTAKRKETNSVHTGLESYNTFLLVSFPDTEVKILDYNRVVKDLNGLSPSIFLESLKQNFQISDSEFPVKPSGAMYFGMYLDKKWYCLRFKGDLDAKNPNIKSLDVSILADYILKPVLGIIDVRTDPRIGFVGGSRGLSELKNCVESGNWSVSFSLFPISIRQLIQVADANEIMPPKTTWFEPKLADGLVSLVLD